MCPLRNPFATERQASIQRVNFRFHSAQINPGTGESNTKHSDSAGFSRISLSACVLLQQVLPEWCSKLELKFFCTAGSSKLD